MIVVVGLLFLPWLGETLFNTKGEPREAIVAVSMLDSGDWVLPVSHGEDIPYKPPMLAWLISVCSLLFGGGEVSEFTARMPSALAAMAMLVAGFRFFAPKVGERQAWLITLITATSFEVFRAATVCRVDMVLTAAMVGGVYAIYNIDRRRLNWLWAVLLLSVATLTKGPVGSLLPCLAMGIYFLLRGDNFWRTLVRLVTICLASFILPALWYYVAWLEGGDKFLALALEENVGRLTGTMSYDSHVNPWYYNVMTIAAGMLPWTIATLVALSYRSVRRRLRSLRYDRGLPLMAWTVGLTIFVFYCIPASKRSVYLLPCYPFIAYGVARLIDYVRDTRFLHVLAVVFAVLSIVAPVAALVAPYVMPARLAVVPLWRWFVAMVPPVIGIWWLVTRTKSRQASAGLTLMTFALMLSWNAVFAPMALNPKSDRPAAQKIATATRGDETVWSIVEGDSLLRHYTINYYLGDRLRRATTLDSVPVGASVIAPSVPQNIIGDTLTRKSCDTRRPVILFRKTHAAVAIAK